MTGGSTKAGPGGWLPEIGRYVPPPDPAVALAVTLDQPLMHHGQVLEVRPVVVMQSSPALDRLLHVELGRAHQLDGRGHVVHRLVPQPHDGRERLGVLVGVALDGALPLPADGAVAGIGIARGRDVDDRQQAQGNAEQDQEARLGVAQEQRWRR